jgi:hypothetical protein
METQPQQSVTPILEIAWTRHAQFDGSSGRRSKAHLRLRRWIATLSVLATLFAILADMFPVEQFGLVGFLLKLLLVLSPLLGSGLAYYTARNLSSGDWLITRAGAEEIRKEIYLYRTVLQKSPNRNKWLEKRLAEIQRSVFRGLHGELTMRPYEGPLPPGYSPEDPYGDSGFDDLSGDEYFRRRLEFQLGWHSEKVVKRQAERTRLQIFIIASGIAGAVLAVFLPIWVALAASFTAVFMGWQELRNLDVVIRNYSKVLMELNIIHDHWINLTDEEKTRAEFYKMVRATEDILWSQNVEYIKAMQEALKESDLEDEAGLVSRLIRQAEDSDQRVKQSMQDAIVDFTGEKLHEAEEKIEETFETALQTLAEDASSELVQAELEAMQKDLAERFSGLKSLLHSIAEEFSGVEINRDTPPAVLNDYLARFPKSQEAKG